eukprot:m.82013 g.82013  ORF g.82013 m.82013 type:complete len:153 (+) comp13385_c1_seq2:194-652(+)
MRAAEKPSRNPDVLDGPARARRARKFLERLEDDHAGPLADVSIAAEFTETIAPDTDDKKDKKAKKRKRRGFVSQRQKKNLATLISDMTQLTPPVPPPNYLTAMARPPVVPALKCCAVCGLLSKYSCVACGAYYCSFKCRDHHIETRCIKWTG